MSYFVFLDRILAHAKFWVKYDESWIEFSHVLKNGSFVCFALQDPLKNDLLAVQSIRNNIISLNLNSATSQLVHGNNTRLLLSFLVTVPTFIDRRELINCVARNVNHGCLFWSIGLRAFYFLFVLFLWIFGPIPMFVCCGNIMLFVLYVVDTTTGVPLTGCIFAFST
ncbi:hypothetical protein HanHA300_Chr00c0576g0785391 [Helianthus annuus]|nr:hypothetical protein HanHA300_Chr16g0615631 [Helianthus annuus]KAJ0460919.1 hypothetical protein HanHA89_Chr16g0666421 [Helianthus annuus]KAJ0629824.1 hypothetical protein HanHA300_Chr00c0576g0785391 [Helianthus annuus]KAJ0641346.1 hypothetical protein HanLR1_Chr16g0626151 [Helianthus annuus]KAJ0641350.1 hypothetical protein HanLR1_Chr16g0626191 [Helianthus annuus]